ncbi:WGR domain-containing protein [Pedosphaera parvula]|uniref:WGR domain protein n=1 Tax=Pedosphaera parvula (strain Ellin514) TaxID=320771 RepID=B9XLD7_PEDPL|nr:WGR domain-containing protein [Pedosphaera parvula]EEF59340.1 WGR domain protein [Pedosphaera parvula Ellin514]
MKNFLQYAEAVSKGDERSARRVLENLNPLTRKTLAPEPKRDAVMAALAEGLRKRGYAVDVNVGQSKFRCDLAVRNQAEELHQLGVMVDTEGHYANSNLLDRYLMQPSILRAFGWRFALVLTKDWYQDPEDVMNRLERVLKGEAEEKEVELPLEPAPVTQAEVKAQSNTAPASVGVGARKSESAASPKAQPGASTNRTRRFEFVGGGSQKFWEITLSGNSFTVRFGKIGTDGQSQSKNFADEVRARGEMESLIAEKLKKGYVER